MMHFESIFLSGMKYMGQNSYFCIWIPNCSSNVCGKWYHLFIDLPQHICQKSVDHIWIGLVLGSLLCSTDLCVYHLLMPFFPNYYSFIVDTEIRWLSLLSLLFFCLGCSMFFTFPYKF